MGISLVPTGPTPTPAAPAAPAPSTPAPAEPPKSAVLSAIAEMREKLANGEPLVPADSGAAPPAGEAPPAAGQAPATDDPAPGAGEGEEAGEPAAAGEAAGEGGEGVAGGEAGEAGEESAGAAEIVALPGRNAGETVEIEVADPEVAERLRQLANMGLRTEHFEQQMAQVEAMRADLELRPTEVLLDAYGQHPDMLAHVALHLVTRPEVWQKIHATIKALGNEQQLELVRAKTEAQQVKFERAAQTIAEQRAAVDRNEQEIKSALRSLVPEGLTSAQREQFLVDAQMDLVRYAESRNLLTIDIEDVPLVLRRRLAAYGLTPDDASTRLSVPPKAAAKPAAPKGKPAAPAAPKNGAAFVKAAQVRQRTASVAPASAATPAGTPAAPPPNQSIQERIAWHKQQIASRRKAL